MPSANVIQLRQMLSEKFPGLRLKRHDPTEARQLWPTGLPQIDLALGGGLPKKALTEIVSEGKSSGSATLLRALISRAAAERQIVTLIDGQDALDVTQIEEAVLSRLLWIRCRAADEAVKALDLVLRDANLRLVFVDLNRTPLTQLRRVPSTTWYRFQRLVEESEVTCVVLAPVPMSSPAQVRITVKKSFSLNAIEIEADECAKALTLEVTDLRHKAGQEIARLNVA